jgi:hypothetical protein
LGKASVALNRFALLAKAGARITRRINLFEQLSFSLVQRVKKFPRGENCNAGVLLEIEQVTVAADDIVGPAGDGAFEDAVIIGIVRHYVQNHFRVDQIGNGFELGTNSGGVLRQDSEFDAELVLEFIQERG